MDTRKRGRPDIGFSVNGGVKKRKQGEFELGGSLWSTRLDIFCTVSITGCQFGESCHFLHYVPGGYNAVAQMMNLPPAVSASSRNMAAPSSIFDGAVPAVVKTKMCNKYNSAEDCKFGNKCHFAHGEWELGKPTVPVHDDPRVMGNVPGRFGDRMESPSAVRAASFGVSATAEISVDASLAGAIIGKAGVNSKQICWQTGAKLSIRDHESDPNLRNIELEGNFDQIKRASAMVRELISRIGPMGGPPKGQCGPGNPKGNIKTKLCENFAKGSCTFGDRCHFAHGNAELRKPGVEGV